MYKWYDNNVSKPSHSFNAAKNDPIRVKFGYISP